MEYPNPAAEPRHDDAPSLRDEISRVYEDHATGLFGYAFALTRNEDRARDALQDAFLRLFVSRREGQRIREPKAWLFRAVRNCVFDALKSSSARLEVGIGELRHTHDHRASPEAAYGRTEAARRIEQVLAPREMECLRLRTEGLSYDEIGAVMSIRPGTVGALLTRAHKKIRAEMSAATIYDNAGACPPIAEGHGHAS